MCDRGQLKEISFNIITSEKRSKVRLNFLKTAIKIDIVFGIILDGK